MPSVDIGAFSIGDHAPLALIAGPCVIESAEHTLAMARAVKQAAAGAALPAIFKVSYDKANRTSVDSYRGPGLEDGLAILSEVTRLTVCPS